MASSVTLEGVVRFLRGLPLEELKQCSIGSYDWDPFASYLRFPVHMVRQDVDALLSEAFQILDNADSSSKRLLEVKPHLIVSDC